MIEIKKAAEENISDLVDIRIRFMCEINHTANYDLRLPETLNNYMKETMIKDEFITWIAVDRNKIVGTSAICFYNLPPTSNNVSGKTAYIMNVYTLEEYRHRGIAYSLFGKVLEEARRKDCGIVYLNATEDGRPLYEKFGFEPKGNQMMYIIK
ncbi:MAG: GNAT family N-acetyltransferase [Bacillota bacterium]|nr:GNAT family N-acetyltransferase [Bacillota bacterium]